MLPSFLVLGLVFPTELPLCVVWCAGYSGLRAPYLGREGGTEGDEGHVQTPLCLQVHLQTHPLPTHLRFPGRSRKSSPMPPSRCPRDTVDSVACLGLGHLHSGPGTVFAAWGPLGEGHCSLGPQMLPTLSLVLVGTRPWGRVSMPGLR